MIKFTIFIFTFICSSTLFGILGGFFYGTITKPITLLSFFLGLLISIKAVFDSKDIKFDFKINKLSIWSKFVFLCLVLFCFRAFLWVIFKYGDDIRELSPHNLGDISLHVNFIKYISLSPDFWLDNPYFSGVKLRYPIGMDFFNSMLVLLGINLFTSLKWVGLICSLLAGFMFYVWGGAFTLAGFLFNGGLISYKFFQSFIFSDYQYGLAWKSLPLAVLVSQRGTLYSIPVGLLLFCSLRNRFFPNDKFCKQSLNNLILPLWLEVLFYSSMPIFHMHTFIFLTFFLAWFFLIFKEHRKYFIKLGINSIPLALFFVLLLTDNFKAGSIIHFQWGWMQSKENFFTFWIVNFGVLLPFFIFLFAKQVHEKRKLTESFVIPGFILLIVFFNVMFAPWDWDNTKLIMWSYFILLPYLWVEVISRFNKYQIIISCFLLFFSGFISLFGGFPRADGYVQTRFSLLTSVESAIKKLNINDRFACYPTFDHPVFLAGHKVAIAYPGWIWTHGYKSQEKEEKLKQLMLGTDKWLEYANDLNVRYIFWGEMEKRGYPASTKPWEKSFKRIAFGSWGEIWDIGIGNTHSN